MFGFTIPFAEAHRRVPGAIARHDAPFATALADPPKSYDLAIPHPASRVTSAESVTVGLGLPPHVEKGIAAIVKSESAGATNEIDFRRGVMTHLFDRRVAPGTRRAVLDRAVAFFRSLPRSGSAPVPVIPIAPTQRPASQLSRVHTIPHELAKAARGGNYHRRIPKPGGGYTYVYDEATYRARPDAHLDGKTAQDEHLKEHVKRIAAKHATNLEGCPIEEFAPLVAKHGAEAVAAAIRPHAHAVKNRRVHFAKADGEPAENTASLPSTSGGGHASEKNLPPGARRIWHNRVVEKLSDNKWHVVGHVAGLEDQRPPRLQDHEITPAARAALFRLIVAQISRKNAQALSRDDK